ncbi:MAG: winged helix-turn-helix transcriptional regulator [Candidatus Bilamarchaeaceae archaeon]
MVAVDNIDRRILYVLDWDSRQPVSRIAKKLGISKDVANYRIRKMIDSGIIRSFYPIVNFHRLGFFPYRVSAKLKNVSYEQEKALISYLVSLENVQWVASCGGIWDLIFVIFARDVYEFQDFYSEFREKFGNCLEKTKIAMSHRMHFFTRGCLLGEDQLGEFEGKEVVSEGSPTEIDDIDWELIGLLGKDARMSLLDLSRRLKLSPNAVDYRMKRLMKDGIIQGFRMLPNLEMLGIKYYKVYFRFSNYDRARISQMFSYAKSNPFIVYMVEALGGADLDLEFQVNSRETFLKTLADFRNRFSDIIRDCDTITLYEEHKLDFVPHKPKKEKWSAQASAEM